MLSDSNENTNEIFSHLLLLHFSEWQQNYLIFIKQSLKDAKCTKLQIISFSNKIFFSVIVTISCSIPATCTRRHHFSNECFTCGGPWVPHSREQIFASLYLKRIVASLCHFVQNNFLRVTRVSPFAKYTSALAHCLQRHFFCSLKIPVAKWVRHGSCQTRSQTNHHSIDPHLVVLRN